MFSLFYGHFPLTAGIRDRRGKGVCCSDGGGTDVGETVALLIN